MSEQAVLAEYWEYWKTKCLESGIDLEFITEENCIKDWVTIYWAAEISENLMKNIEGEFRGIV
jgi:hypothetical protein